MNAFLASRMRVGDENYSAFWGESHCSRPLFTNWKLCTHRRVLENLSTFQDAQ